MPRITLALTTNYENITRPVAMSIARDVMRICDIDQKTPLYMPGEFEQVNQPGTAVGESQDIRWASDRRLVVVAEDSIKNDAVLTGSVRDNEQPPFLDDRRLGVSLRPVYVTSDLVLSFKYICATRQEAVRWRDEMAVKRKENRTAITHQIEYDIPISDGTLGTLAHLYELRENIAGYGQSFAEWFKAIQCVPFHLIGTVDGRDDTLSMMVKQRQAAITGYFDFSDIPKERKVAGNSTWEIEFSYNLQYDRCTHLYFVYPMVVHQQHIGADFFDATPRFSVEELDKHGSIGIKALDTMNEWVNYYPAPTGGLRVPYYDEWIPPKSAQPVYTVPIISWMIVLDPSDPQDILDLSTLPDMTFINEIDTLFRNGPEKLTVKGRSPVMFTLYCDDTPMAQEILVIDEHLRVRTTRPLDLRRSYHLRMSFVTNYALLVPECIMDMKTNPVATLLLFQTIVPPLDVEWAMRRLIDGKYIVTNYLVWFYQFIMDHGYGMFNQGGHPSSGPGGNDKRWKGGISGAGRNSGGQFGAAIKQYGPRDPSLYTGSNWRVNMSDGGITNPDGSGGGGNTGYWDEDGVWHDTRPGGGGNNGGNNGGGFPDYPGSGNGDGGYPPGWVDITTPGVRSRENGGVHYVQFLSIMALR